MQYKILTYHDLFQIKAGENNEKLVSLNEFAPEILCQYEKMDMLSYIGNEIFVRQAVASMLLQASNFLKQQDSDYVLKVVYGYRHPEVQQKYFDKRKGDIKKQEPNLSENDLNAKTHLFVAAPDVAGHIVGGAVDVTVTNRQGDLDMATKIADYSDEKKIQTFYKNLSSKQKNNRMLLHDIMVKVGFAPFYGEWWHFSYGDKEWAAFYGKLSSLYSPVYFRK